MQIFWNTINIFKLIFSGLKPKNNEDRVIGCHNEN